MKITIHRGTHQIGGVVVEISTDANRIFIDIGDDLPGTDAAPFEEIDGLTCGNPTGSALFLTHYHRDHIGRLPSVMPDVPIYMGETAKKILLNLAHLVDKENLPLYEKITTFKPADKIMVGGIAVMPLMVDHSAFDAYMFVVTADGKRVLHTGDFRTHGFRGGKTAKMLSAYAKDIDYIISEGTMLGRAGERVISERELQTKATKLLQENKYSFVLCSSTNIDRIAAFYHAARKARRIFLCDKYQRDQLEAVRAAHAEKSSLYDFKNIYDVKRIDTVSDKLISLIEDKGFCMLLRKNDNHKPYLKRYGENAVIIYSMWSGYLSGKTADSKLIDFLAPYHVIPLHTSGHATAEALKEIYNTVKPKAGLIPFHSFNPEAFEAIIEKDKIILLADGEVFNA